MTATVTPPFFPARPVNGGPLEYALPKSGDWSVEGKYNGWRAWVHNPTGLMFNRHLQPLSIEHEFKASLATLTRLPWEWSDVEALERRHNIGRGSLILLDYLPSPAQADQDYFTRKEYIHLCASLLGVPVHKELNVPIKNETLYLAMTWKWTPESASQLWNILKQCNTALGVQPGKAATHFWEGMVAKRNDSPYPRQRRNGEVEFPYWMKHRWAF